MQSQGQSSIFSYLEFSTALPDDELPASYAALAWVESHEEVSIGDLNSGGRAVNTYSTLRNGLVNKRLGAKDSGDVSAEFASDITNAAQILLQAAYDNGTKISVKEVVGENEDTYYFQAYVSNATISVGDVNTVSMFKPTFAVTSNVVPA